MKREPHKALMPELELIKQAVEIQSGIVDISIPSKKIDVIVARSVYYMAALKLHPNTYRLEDIGRGVGTVHATVVNARRKFDNYMRDFPHFERIYKNILQGKYAMYYDEMLAEIRHLREENKRVKAEGKLSHLKELYELIEAVPEYHVENILTRLKPIVRMLEKPNRYNRYRLTPAEEIN